MLQHYVRFLVAAIREHPKVKKHAQLKSDKWTKSGYEAAANIICAELDLILPASEKNVLGTTISSKTLNNMFKGEYRLSYPLDPRTLNTLTKLSRFCGYAEWEALTAQADTEQQAVAHSDDPAVAALNVLQTGFALSFKCYADLPELDPNALLDYYLDKSPAFNRLMDNLLHYRSLQCHIGNPYNPSTFDVLDTEVVQHSEAQVRIKTHEYWLLCWWSEALGKYVRRHKSMNDYVYTVVKTDDGWRIKGVATLADLTESEDWEIAATQTADN